MQLNSIKDKTRQILSKTANPISIILLVGSILTCYFFVSAIIDTTTWAFLSLFLFVPFAIFVGIGSIVLAAIFFTARMPQNGAVVAIAGLIFVFSADISGFIAHNKYAPWVIRAEERNALGYAELWRHRWEDAREKTSKKILAETLVISADEMTLRPGQTETIQASVPSAPNAVEFQLTTTVGSFEWYPPKFLTFTRTGERAGYITIKPTQADIGEYTIGVNAWLDENSHYHREILVNVAK